MLVSDEITNIGTIPIDDIVTKLSEACRTQGPCDKNSVDFNGYMNLGSKEKITLTVDSSGTYPPKNCDILIEVLKSSFYQIASCDGVDDGSCTEPIKRIQLGNCRGE